MEEQRYGNILIMAPEFDMDDFFIDLSTDFYVDSFCNPLETLSLLQKLLKVLAVYTGPFPIVRRERILLSIRYCPSYGLHFYIETPIDKQTTLHILSRICTLLSEPNLQLNFFCPNQ